MTLKIAIMGKSGAGKDTVADYLIEKYGFTKIRFGTALYEVCEKYFDMKGKDRKLLQDVGLAMRSVKPTVFVDMAEKEILGTDTNIVVPDLRQPNEYEMLKRNGFEFLYVESDLNKRIGRLEKRDNIKIDENYIDRIENNPVETACEEIVRNSDGIIKIDNNGSLEDLYRQIYLIIERI